MFQAICCNLRTLAFIILWANPLYSSKDLKISFWLDSVQKEIYEDFPYVNKVLESLYLEATIQDHYLIVDDDNEGDAAMEQFCQILADEGVSIILDFTYQNWRKGIAFVNEHSIPYLKVNRLLKPFMQMFGDFLKEKHANDIALIFQNEQDTREALMQMIEGYPFRTILLNADSNVDYVQRLSNLRPSPSYYGIFARGTNMNSIFEKISKSDVFARPTEWHFIFLDPRDRVFKFKKQVEFANKFAMNGKSICRAMGMKDTFCASGFTLQRAVLLQILRNIVEISQMNPDWFEPWHFECNNTEAFSSTPVQFDWLDQFHLLDFIAIAMDTEETNQMPTIEYAMNTTISFYSNEHEAKTDLAIWSNGELKKINETISPAKRFFRIGVAEAIPWSYYRRDAHNGNIVLNTNGAPIWEGFCIDFIETLAEKMNFDYMLVPPTKGKFGKRDKNGNWDGIVGDMVSGETDFAVTALKMYSEREEVIDYIAPYFEQTGISIVIRKPVRQTSLFKFMTVLRIEVWLCIIAALVATAIMLWVMDKYSPYSSRNNKEAYPYPCREFTLRESFWFALTSFTPQGGGEAPKAISGRILVAAYWLFVVLMLATFTANLAAFLTVERMQTPVQSLEQLARQSRINYTVVHESDTHQYFINMKFAEDTLYRMWKELSLNASEDYHKYRIWDYPIKEQYGHILLSINASQPVKDAAEGFRKVNEHENADFAFIHDSAEIKYEITLNCNLTEVGEVFGEQPYAIAVQQGSHLADELSYATLELQKDRYFEELKAKYWNNSRLKDCPLSENQEGITLESLGGVFIATLFGLGIAMLTLALEVFYYKRKNTTAKQFGSITKVKPVPPLQTKPLWEANQRRVPSSHTATFRGKKIPEGITLGDGEFKPRRLGFGSKMDNLSASALREETMSNVDSDLPPYVE